VKSILENDINQTEILLKE